MPPSSFRRWGWFTTRLSLQLTGFWIYVCVNCRPSFSCILSTLFFRAKQRVIHDPNYLPTR